MVPLFPRWSTSLGRAALVTLAAGCVGAPVALMAAVRMPWMTGEGQSRQQPVAFDHRHHVRDDAIGCLYCHNVSQRSSWAGIPSTDLCLGCHAQIWAESPRLALVRDSAASGRPIRWNRVYDLPDFVFFNHAAHVDRGVGCSTCHGRVDLMADVYQAVPLTMGWCLDCHRDPAPAIRPLDRVTDMEWVPDRVAGQALVDARGIHPPEDCSGCHR